jgi:hypothetical protein
MPENPTILVENATDIPQDIRVAKSIATILPGDRIRVYDVTSPEDDKFSALLARGFRLVVEPLVVDP